MDLWEFFEENPSVALGFSGGVDSAYLLYAGLKLGARVAPYFVKTPFQPGFELADARRLAFQLGVSLRVIELDVLAVPCVAENPENRCYYCKKAMFTALQERAAADGLPVLIDGTNASDDDAGRPGMRALAELGVKSPLRDCGLTKAEIRRRSREAGLFTWDKAAYACLATRIPGGRTITGELLERVERSEETLAKMGFRDFRVRVFQDAARVQLRREEMKQAAEQAEALCRRLAPWFDTVLLDLRGRE